ncbi:chromatin associated protein, partial [Cyathus striatus]
HKGLQSAPRTSSSQSTGQRGSARLVDSLEVIKQEFDILASEVDSLRSQRDEYEAKVVAQLNELSVIRRALYDLEAQHFKVRQQYEEEATRLRSELAAVHQSRNPPSSGIQSLPSRQPVQDSSLPTSANASDSRAPREQTTQDQRDREKPGVYNDGGGELDRDHSIDVRDPKRLKMRREPSTQSTPALTPGQLAAPPSKPGHSTLPSISTGPIGPKGGYVELSLQTAPASCRKEGNDWFAVFNPKIQKRLDIDLVHTFQHESVVCCVQFSPDGRYLATGCNRTAQIFDSKTGHKVCVLLDDSAEKSGDLYIRSVRFSPDGRLLATGAEDRLIRVWDIQSKRIIHVFDGHEQEIYSLDFSRDGRLIISGSGDKTTRIWDLNDKSCKIFTINDSDSLENDCGATSVAISPNGAVVAAGSLDTVVRLWDVVTGRLLERLRGHRDSVYSVAFTPCGMGLVTGSLDKSLKYWDISGIMNSISKGKEPHMNGNTTASASSPAAMIKQDGDKSAQSPCIMNFVGHKDYVLSVAISDDGKWVISGSKDRCVQFWDAQDSTLQLMLQGHKNSVISLDVTSGNLLATGSGDYLARICKCISLGVF